MRMIAAERRAAGALAAIYGMRMLGLFLVLPVIALAARELSGATPLLVGLAIGIYGLTQAFLQIPFGFASDRFGRKAVIAFGLTLFALGSALAAVADSIWLLILGRALQGGGAIAAALMALAADLTRDAVRTRVMAIIGVSIGLSFSAALVIGPVFRPFLDLGGLFWLSTGLALTAIVLLFTVVPTPRARVPHRDATPVLSQFRELLADRRLLRFNLGILALHLLMTSTFVGAPLTLQAAGLPEVRHWELYLPVFVASVLFMAPLILLGERGDRAKPVFLISVALLAAAHGTLALAGGGLLLPGLGLMFFFIGFNVLEANLPALVSRAAPAAYKGTALGLFAAFQFFGAFLGGLIGGALDARGGPGLVFLFGATVGAVWLLLSLPMRLPPPVASYVVPLRDRSRGDQAASELSALPGVEEAVVVAEEGVAYLKIDPERFDPAELERAGYLTEEEAEDGQAAEAAPVR